MAFLRSMSLVSLASALTLGACGGDAGSGAPQDAGSQDAGAAPLGTMPGPDGGLVASGNNDPKPWCGRNGRWEGLREITRIADGVIDCPDPNEFQLELVSCATRATLEPCRFEYLVVRDSCLDGSACASNVVTTTRCDLELPTDTIVRGRCTITETGSRESNTVDELTGTWTGP